MGEEIKRSSIVAEILGAGGKVSLARFMELALSHPEEGYYATKARVLGRRGDFTTVPVVSPEFCLAVARLAGELAAGLVAEARTDEKVVLVELGPGEGNLARALLDEWEKERPDLKERIELRLVEINKGLRRRQERMLTTAIGRGWQVGWCSSVEEACAGKGRAPLAARHRADADGELRLVLGNEFLDSLPVHLVQVERDESDLSAVRVREAFVEAALSPVAASPAGESSCGEVPFLREVWEHVTVEARAELALLFGCADAETLLGFTADGYLELRPAVGRLLAQVTEGARGVCLLTIDYGDWFGKNAGGAGEHLGACANRPYCRTLRGYFRHQRVKDVLARVGHQDLTADVDFRALDVHGRLLGYQTVFYVTVAQFLRGGLLPPEKNAFFSVVGLEEDRRASMLRALLDPGDLGGAFKVMLQAWEKGDYLK